VGVCDTTTGMYTVTVTLQNNIDEPGDMGTLGWQASDASGPSQAGQALFSPDPMPPLGTTSASFQVPGDTVLIELSIGVEYAQFVADTNPSQELGGDCQLVIPTSSTTTTPTTSASTTTTTAAAQVAQPRFTG
jgi:hypothetical protein